MAHDIGMLVVCGYAAQFLAGTLRLVAMAPLYASDVTSIVMKGTGHWLIDEAPDRVIRR